MPRHMNYYEPDQIDCNTIQTAIGADFGLLCEVTTTYERDQVQVVCKAYRTGEDCARMVQVQSKVSAPLRTAKSLYTMQYSAMLDCWHQLDRGVLGVAQTHVVRDWNGRPKTPGRTVAQ